MNSLSTFNSTRTKTCSLCHKTMRNPYYCSTCDAPIGYTLPCYPLRSRQENALQYVKGNLNYAQEELRVIGSQVELFTEEQLSECLLTFANYLLMLASFLPEPPEEENETSPNSWEALDL